MNPDNARLRDAAFESGAEPQLVVDRTGTLVALNAAARRVFGLTQAALGEPLHNLEVSYRPADLRSAIDRVKSDRREVALRAQPWDHGGGARFFDVTATPLLDSDASIMGVRVAFSDVTPLKSLQDALKASKQELESAYEELQSTNEELETTNAELQSTVEELETTNEELQSTNEELETMNEELQSTNEDLQTMNDALRNRSMELNSSNAFLESLFTGLRAAVVVLDRDLHVQVWNTGALDMWGLRPDETVGASFFTLDFGLPVDQLHQPVRQVLSGAAAHRETVVAATNRKGRAIRCQVRVAPLKWGDRGLTGAILLMEEHREDQSGVEAAQRA